MKFWQKVSKFDLAAVLPDTLCDFLTEAHQIQQIMGSWGGEKEI
jgi:hypothetical protein